MMFNVKVLTKYGSAFPKDGETDDPLAFNDVPGPAEEETEEQSTSPRQAGRDASLRKLES